MRAIGASPAILMQNHGVFTVGKDAGAAVKAAVMVEDIGADGVLCDADRAADRDPEGDGGAAAQAVYG